MRCPICKQNNFTTTSLAENLNAQLCSTCTGLFITCADFFNFRTYPTPLTPTPIAEPSTDNQPLKLCPACSKFMRHFDVGHSLHFAIDKCNTCGNFWLDLYKWQSLASKNLHTQLNLITSNDWQKEIERDQRSAAETARLLRHLGEPDFTELSRITQWLTTHPHRDELLAYLHSQLEASTHPIT